jgi:hypothetical protein
VTVTVLRFAIGTQPFAIAAGAVESIDAVRPESLHLALALGQVPTPGENSRTIRVTSGSRRIEVVVDAPIEFLALDHANITPCRTTTSATLIGFADVGVGPIGLFDAAALIDLVEVAMAKLV